MPILVISCSCKTLLGNHTPTKEFTVCCQHNTVRLELLIDSGDLSIPSAGGAAGSPTGTSGYVIEVSGIEIFSIVRWGAHVIKCSQAYIVGLKVRIDQCRCPLDIFQLTF